MIKLTGQSFPRLRKKFNLTFNYYRPFKIIPKSDGRPAVEVESDGKTKQYVRGTFAAKPSNLTLFSWWIVC